MTGAGYIDCVQVVLVDQTVEVNVGEALAGVRAPVAQQPRLYMLEFERLPQQRVVPEVQHPQAQVEAGLPVCVDPAQLIGAQRGPFDRGASRPISADALVSLSCQGPLGWSCHICVLLFIVVSY